MDNKKNGNRYWMIVLGISIIIIAGILASISLVVSNTVRPKSGVDYMPTTILLLMIPTAISGIVVTCFGLLYATTKKKYPERKFGVWPILLLVLALIIITFIACEVLR